MHEQIEEYLRINTYDADTRWGTVNEGKNLLAYLKTHGNGNDEPSLLLDIDEYSFNASSGRVWFRQKETRTFLNEGLFSFYYNHDHYVSHLFDGHGGKIILTERTLYDHEPEIHFTPSPPSAWGELYMFSSIPKEMREKILSNAERQILCQCQDHFGQWFAPQKTEPPDKNPPQRSRSLRR